MHDFLEFKLLSLCILNACKAKMFVNIIIFNTCFFFILQLRITPKNGTGESFQFIYGDSVEKVREKKKSSIQLPQVLQNMKLLFNMELKDMSFSPFNQSCIGVHSNQKYMATFKYKSRLLGIPLGYNISVCIIYKYMDLRFDLYRLNCFAVYSKQRYNATFIYRRKFTVQE